MGNFNYMLPKVESLRKCPSGNKHYYLPISVEATVGNIGIKFFCKRCDQKAVAFLTDEEYSINKNLIENSIKKYYGE